MNYIIYIPANIFIYIIYIPPIPAKDFVRDNNTNKLN